MREPRVLVIDVDDATGELSLCRELIDDKWQMITIKEAARVLMYEVEHEPHCHPTTVDGVLVPCTCAKADAMAVLQIPINGLYHVPK